MTDEIKTGSQTIFPYVEQTTKAKFPTGLPESLKPKEDKSLVQKIKDSPVLPYMAVGLGGLLLGYLFTKEEE